MNIRDLDVNMIIDPIRVKAWLWWIRHLYLAPNTVNNRASAFSSKLLLIIIN